MRADRWSGHTALVGSTVVEGHVPAADGLRLPHERPVATRLAVPGMPTGSPGMEMREAFEVVLFAPGRTEAFGGWAELDFGHSGGVGW